MSGIKIFIQDATLRAMHAELAERNAYLKRIVDAYANDDWDTVAANVKAGRARALYGIGDVFLTNYTATNGTVYENPWVVAQNDITVYDRNDAPHPGMILTMQYATAEDVMFDNAEGVAVDLAQEPNAVSGWYYYGVNGSTWTALNLEPGAAIPMSYPSVYKCPINDVNAARYGYNRWSHSAVRQWLNSAEAQGNWWTAQHEGDVAPSQAGTINGFMRGLEDEMLAVINPARVNTACNTVTDGGVTDVTYDKFFLPSLEEVYGVPQVSGIEGAYWPYCKDVTGLTAPSNGSGSDTNEARKIKRISNKTGSAASVRLRSAYRGGASNTWFVYSGGYLTSGYGGASGSNAATPACVIF